MKKVLFILIISIFFQSCQEKKQENIDFSGDYIGFFVDVKGIAGTIELTLFQSVNGQTSGTILMRRESEKDSLTTGIINVSSDGKIFNGNLMPSVIRYQTLDSENKNGPVRFDSYSCRWSLLGEIVYNNNITIAGKAVPMNCSESNMMQFTLEKVQRKYSPSKKL